MRKLLNKDEYENISGGIITISQSEVDKDRCKIYMTKNSEILAYFDFIDLEYGIGLACIENKNSIMKMGVEVADFVADAFKKYCKNKGYFHIDFEDKRN